MNHKQPGVFAEPMIRHTFAIELKRFEIHILTIVSRYDKGFLTSDFSKCGFLLLDVLVGPGDARVAEIHLLLDEKCDESSKSFRHD